jgi:hypothetical protein
MRGLRFLIVFLTAMGGFLWLTISSTGHPLYVNVPAVVYHVSSESTLTWTSEDFHPRFFSEWEGWDIENKMWSFHKVSVSPSPFLLSGEANSASFQPKRPGINRRRAWVLGTANAGTIFWGFKQAIESWGKTKGEFHIKGDWRGDNLAQIDELSHFMWGYRMTQFLFSAYQWAGFSPKASRMISVSQTAMVLTLVEYPIDAYNPKQGLGFSDLVFDYLGIGFACMKERCHWLEDFDVKISSRGNILMGNQPVFAQTYEEFDNFIYWITYRTNLFLPRKALCFGLGYGVTHPKGEAERQIFGGIGLSLPDCAALFSERLGNRLKFLEMFYPHLSVEF